MPREKEVLEHDIVNMAIRQDSKHMQVCSMSPSCIRDIADAINSRSLTMLELMSSCDPYTQAY
jgi:hypothetical protein